MLDAKVLRVESLRPDCPVLLEQGNFRFWREFVEVGDKAEILQKCVDGEAALVRQGAIHYICGWPDEQAMDHLLKTMCKEAGVGMLPNEAVLPDGLRLRQNGNLVFAFNYSDSVHDLSLYQIGDPPAA